MRDVLGALGAGKEEPTLTGLACTLLTVRNTVRITSETDSIVE